MVNLVEKETSFIPALEGIVAEVDNKNVSARQHPEDPYLWVFNYTPRVQFDKLWNDTNKACRGLILKLDGPLRDPSTKIKEVVALPWPKFFNVGENGLWPTSEVTTVTEKMDGSLGILYRTQSTVNSRVVTEYNIATRGSFTSDQAKWATVNLAKGESSGGILTPKYRLELVPDNLTLLFEIIYPGSHVVVDYGFEGLVLLGARDRLTGKSLSFRDVMNVAVTCGFNLVPELSISGDIVNRLHGQECHCIGIDREGWVLTCENGSRWKIKGDEYRKYHNILSRLSERYVIDRMIDGTVDELMDGLPSHYQQRVVVWRDVVNTALSLSQDHTLRLFRSSPFESGRKEFAMWVMQNHPKDSHYLFSMYDGRSIVPSLLKVIRDYADTEPLISGVE